MPSEPTTLVAVRLTDRLIGRVERHAKRLAKVDRGVKFTRSDAIRDLLISALDRIEGSGDDQ